jgi:hypothetical protein
MGSRVEGEQDRRPRIDQFLVRGNLPRPIKLVIAAVLWPIMAVLFALGGLSGLALGVMVLIIVLALVLVLVTGGASGASYLAQHPGALVPHNPLAWIGLVIALPVTVWWVRGLSRDARLEREQRQRAEEIWHLEAVAEGVVKPSGLEADVERAQAREQLAHLKAAPDPESPAPTTGLRYAVIALGALAWLVFLWFFAVALHQVAANDPAAGVFVPAVALIAVAVVYFRSYAGMGDERAKLIVIPLGALVAVLVIGSWVGLSDRSGGELRKYCDYGVVSSAELAGCLDHVSDAQIDRRNTDAARFAKGALWQCLSDSGPFCAARLEQMKANQNPDD